MAKEHKIKIRELSDSLQGITSESQGSQKMKRENYLFGICSTLVNTETKQECYGMFPEKEIQKTLDMRGHWDLKEYYSFMFHSGASWQQN